MFGDFSLPRNIEIVPPDKETKSGIVWCRNLDDGRSQMMIPVPRLGAFIYPVENGFEGCVEIRHDHGSNWSQEHTPNTEHRKRSFSLFSEARRWCEQEICRIAKARIVGMSSEIDLLDLFLAKSEIPAKGGDTVQISIEEVNREYALPSLNLIADVSERAAEALLRQEEFMGNEEDYL